LFDYLSEPAHLADFEANANAPEMVTLKWPGDPAAFSAFARAWPQYRANLEKLKSGCVVAVAKIESELKTPIEQALDRTAGVSPAGNAGETPAVRLLSALRSAGFESSDAELAAICAERH